MRLGRRAWAAIAAGATVLVGGAVALALRGGPPIPGIVPPVISPTPVPLELVVRVTQVRGTAVAGPAGPRTLEAAEHRVRATIKGLYEAGFVDPAAWQGGRFPGIYRFFNRAARPQVRRDLPKLTLGSAATRLTAVEPDPAHLKIQFLVGPTRRPIAAFADMAFEATGFDDEGGEVEIRHTARYLLRPSGTHWLIKSYQDRSVRPQGDVGTGSAGPLFLLLIGSDSRPGTPVDRGLGDSLHIIGVNPEEGMASVLGIPRDSYVPIPGAGTRKINSALTAGGPDLMVRTVEELTNIPIDAYLLAGFDGFRRMVAEVGGLEITIPYAMSDASSGARFQPGRTRLDAGEALALARNRKDAPRGDFGRSLNQGRIIVATVQELLRDFARDPLTLFRWVVAGYRYLETDLTLEDTLRLLVAALTIDAGHVRNEVVSGVGAFAGSQSIVRLTPQANVQFRDMARDGLLGR